MSDQEKRDHWGELVENVGATPPPEHVSTDQPNDEIDAPNIEQSDGASEVAGKEDIDVVEVSPRKVRAYRPKSGWDDLASEFDLPIPEKSAPVKEEAKVEKVEVREEEVTEEPIAEISALNDVDSVLDEVAVDETLDAREQAEEVEAWLGATEFDALFEDSLPGERDEDAAKEVEVPSFEEAVEVASKEIAKEEGEEEKSGGKRRKKRRRRSRKTTPSDEKGDVEEVTVEAEEITVEIVPSEDSDGFGAGLFGDGSEESKKKRGRRRRRRGSGKKKEDAVKKTADEELVSEISVGEDIVDKEPKEESGRRRSKRKRSDADRQGAVGRRRDRSEEDAEQDEIRAVSHRGIPSWDEAVEHIITTNLEKRSKKSSGNSSSRQRGGRSRSGREKSGSRKRSS